jgi:DNA-binding transcriptional LysR family regulator
MRRVPSRCPPSIQPSRSHADLSSVWRSGRLGLLSPRVWRLCDLAAKHHFLRAGFGFGIMPKHMVEADLASGALVEIRVEDDPPEGHVIAMSAVYLTDSPLGPAGRWWLGVRSDRP